MSTTKWWVKVPKAPVKVKTEKPKAEPRVEKSTDG